MTRTDGPVRFGGEPFTVSDRCVNVKHRGASCTRCSEVCPVDAVAIGADRPRLDPSSCIRCGACVPVCPIEAIGSGPSGQRLHFAVADTPPGAPITLACPLGGNDTQAMPVVRHDRCLAAVGGEELLELAGEPRRELWLDDSPCAACDLGGLHEAIVSAVGKANRLLEVFGFDPTVHLGPREAPSVGQPAGARPSEIIDARGGAMSRRGMFRRLIGEVTGRLSVTGAHDDGVPPRRRRLLQLLRGGPAPQAGGPAHLVRAALGFGAVRVDSERCTACGLCARFCPTGALTAASVFEPDGRAMFDLEFRPASCVDCGVCAVACPEDAIVVEPHVDPFAVVSGTSATVARRPVVACDNCGLSMAETATAMGRCFSCRGGVVSPLRDEAGLMKDLLGRVSELGTDEGRTTSYRHAHDDQARFRPDGDDGGRGRVRRQRR